MTHIEINRKALDMLNGENLITLLDNMINDELSKDIDKIDTAFVDECVDALLELEKEENGFVALVPLMSSDKFLKKLTGSGRGTFKSLNVFARTAIIAAIIAGTTFTANAGIQAVTGVNVIGNIASAIEQRLKPDNDTPQFNGSENINDDFEETSEPVADTTQPTDKEQTTQGSKDDNNNEGEKVTETTTTEVTGSENINDDFDDEPATRPQKPVATAKPVDKKPALGNQRVTVTQLTADITNVKTDYIYGEEISYDGIVLTVHYSDGSKKSVDINDCYYTKILTTNKTADYTLTVMYESCRIEFKITYRPNEETRGADICSNEDFDYLLTDNGAYITAYKGNDTSLMLDYIDDIKITSIGEGAFKGNMSIEKCFMPYVSYIGKNAFDGCKKLCEISLAQSISNIGTAAFKGTGLTEVTLPESISKIPDYLFDSCSELKRVTFEGNVTQIGVSAFALCESLERVNGCKNLKTVNAYAFYDDTLVDFDSFPTELEAVGECSFYLCQKLNIGSLPQSIKHIGKSAFAYCTLLTELTIPKGITVIPYEAFRGCGATSVTIPEGVVEIEPYALRAIKAKELRLPSTIRKLGADSIYSQTLLRIYLNKELTEIADTAIYPSKAVTLYVYEGSEGMQYAVSHSINYKIITQEGE